MKINAIDIMIIISILSFISTYLKTPTDPESVAAFLRVIVIHIQGVGIYILLALSIIYGKVTK